MRTRCPQCRTIYNIDTQALEMAKNMARCFNCNTVFNALENSDSEQSSSEQPHVASDEFSAAVDNEFAELDYELQLDFTSEPTDEELPDLPFEVPDDLPALEPSDKAALDLHDSLHPQTKTATPWWQKGLTLLLAITFLGQLIWFYRIPLMQQPQAQTLCLIIDCSEAQRREADAFSIVQREIEPNPDQPGSLKLVLHFRNSATFAQPLPDLQLALFDSNESLLARRRILPREYTFPASTSNRLIAPQEVVTISLAFEDPGSRASGFKIDFL